MKIKSIFLVSFIVFILVGASLALGQGQNQVIKAKKKILVLKPDLKVKSVSAGFKPLTVKKGVKNGWIKCRWTKSGAITEKWVLKVYADGTEVGSAWIEPTNMGSHTVPWQATTGNHSFMCSLDWQYNIDELYENNNKILREINIQRGYVRPRRIKTDLIATEVKFAPTLGTTYQAGDEVFYQCGWKRVGPKPPNSFIINRYINDVLIGSSSPPLAATSGYASSRITAPMGRSILKCEIDPLDIIEESNETNNNRTSVITLIPRLRVIKP